MNPEELADFLVAEVRRYVNEVSERTAAELRAAFADMIRALPPPEPGRPGKDFDLDAVKGVIHDEILAQSIAEGVSLRSTIPARVAEAVAEAVALIPPAKNGEPGKDADPETVRAAVAEAVRQSEERLFEAVRAGIAEVAAAIRVPKDGDKGADADMAALTAAIASGVEAAEARISHQLLLTLGNQCDARLEQMVAGLPEPKKGEPGKDADMAAVEALVERLVSEAAAALPVAKDGVSVTGALVDRAGGLVLTLSTGATVDVGRVVGKDADPAEPGKPGLNGLGFDDLNVEHDGERTITLVFQRGEQVKRFPLVVPAVIDRGVYGEGKSYERGDGVSWAGCFWIAQDQTSDKPGEGKTEWRLAVKKGRDGKDLMRKP